MVIFVPSNRLYARDMVHEFEEEQYHILQWYSHFDAALTRTLTSPSISSANYDHHSRSVLLLLFSFGFDQCAWQIRFTSV